MSKPGVYMLLVQAKLPVSLIAGKLGKISLNSGWYCYVGSAMGGVNGRIQRHLSHKKRL